MGASFFVACAQDNENQPSDETYISKEDFHFCVFVFNMLLAQAMQLLQILLSTSGRGQVYTITAPPTCQAGQIIVGKGRVLINYCVLKKCRYFHVLIHRLISITTVSVNTSFLLDCVAAGSVRAS